MGRGPSRQTPRARLTKTINSFGLIDDYLQRHSQLKRIIVVMDSREILGCFALMLGGLSLLQLDNVALRKIGMALIWLASGLAAYFFTNSVALAGLMLLAWMFFPLWEMLFVLRKLRVPRHRQLADARAPRDEFEELADITGLLSEAGFEQIDECRLRPAQHEQYYRIFVREDGLTQATVGYIAQGAIGFHFIAFTSNDKTGHQWITWDYPLTYGLVMPPRPPSIVPSTAKPSRNFPRPTSTFWKSMTSLTSSPFPARRKPRVRASRKRSTSKSNTISPAVISRPLGIPKTRAFAIPGAAPSTLRARSCVI